MQHIKTYFVIALTVLFAPSLFAQKLTPDEHQDALYQHASDLYRKEKYAAAQQLFDRAVQMGSRSTADAMYYAAVCAVRLDNNDAELRLREFLDSYPYSSRCNMARFYMGNFYYSRAKFDRALTYYKTVKVQEVEFNHRSEYNFKTGYCFLQADKLKDAKPYFVQQIGGESKYADASLYYYAHIQYADGEYDLALANFGKLHNSPKFAKLAPNYEVRIYYYLGRYDEMLKMAPALIADPETYKRAEVAQMVAEVYYNRAEYEEALPYYRMVLTINEKPATDPADKTHRPTRAACTPQDNYYQMGYCYYMLQQYDSAALYLERKTACDDSVAQCAFYTLGDIYLHTYRKDDARSMFLQASKLQHNRQIQEDALFCYAKLSCELNKNPYNESIRSFHDYLKRYPNSKHKQEAQEILASLYLTTKNYKDALTLIEGIDNRNAALNKAYQLILVNYGIELFNKGQVELATKQFSKAVSVGADVRVSTNAMYLYGEAIYRQERYDEAARSIDRFLLSSSAGQSPYYPQALYTQGYLLMKSKNYADAATHFANFVRTAKGRVASEQICDAYNRLGDCRYITRNYREAIEQYDQAVRCGSLEADYATYQKAMAYGALGNDPNKFAQLQQLFENYPESSLRAKALLEMADTYLKLDNNEMALAKYDEFITLYPNHSQARTALLNKGLIYYNTERDTLALVVFERLMNKYPESDEARYALGPMKKIYDEQGRVDEFYAYVEENTHITFSNMEQDSAIYLSAEDKYMAGQYAKAAAAFEAYLKKFPKGLFAISAHYYAADSYHRTDKDAKALKHYEAVVESDSRQGQQLGKHTETSLLMAAGIAYDEQDYATADRHYARLAEVAEQEGNRIVGRLGVLRCCELLGRTDSIDIVADQLLQESKITAEHRDEALLWKARASYLRHDYREAITRYAELLASVNGEYAGEAAYRRAECYYKLEQFDDAEKEINTMIDEASSDYWLAKSFILWADIYYNVRHNNLQAKQTLQSIIDNYEGDDLVQEARAKLDAILQSEESDQAPEEEEVIIELDE